MLGRAIAATLCSPHRERRVDESRDRALTKEEGLMGGLFPRIAAQQAMAAENPNVARPGDHRRVGGYRGKRGLRRRIVFRAEGIFLKSEIYLANLESGEVDFKLGID